MNTHYFQKVEFSDKLKENVTKKIFGTKTELQLAFIATNEEISTLVLESDTQEEVLVLTARMDKMVYVVTE